MFVSEYKAVAKVQKHSKHKCCDQNPLYWSNNICFDEKDMSAFLAVQMHFISENT